jgi:hypothetical protein
VHELAAPFGIRAWLYIESEVSFEPLTWQWFESESSLSDSSRSQVSTFDLESQNPTEEMVWPKTAIVEAVMWNKVGSLPIIL